MKNTIKILHPTLILFSFLLLIAAIATHFSPLNQGMRDIAPVTSLLATGYALLGIVTGRLLDTHKVRSMEQQFAEKEQIESAALLLRRAISDAEINGMLRESTALDYTKVINSIERDLVAYSLKEYNNIGYK